MDTNDKTTGPVSQPEEQGQQPPQAAPRPRTARPHAPQMDGVSAGGRPRRPEGSQRAPKKAARAGEPARRPAQRQEGQAQRPANGREGTVRRQTQNQNGQPRRSAEGQPARRRPPEEAARRPRQQAQNKPSAKKNSNTGDSGYQPYRRANQRKKALRSNRLKTFFSNQNPVLQWYERVRYNKDSFAEESDLAKQRQAKREAEAEKRRRKQNRFNTPAVIYTQPAAFNRDKLIVQLISVLSVVIAMMLGLSVFFKVDRITVSGAQSYPAWTIVENSGIEKGDNLLTFSRAKAVSQILANLPYVKDVRIGIKLPDTVNIEVKETDVSYAIKDDQGTWWLINSDARVVEMINNSRASSYTQVLGVTLSNPQVGSDGIATELQPEQTASAEETTGETQETAETLATVPVSLISGAQRLETAKEILKALEDNAIVGEAASVDVTDVDNIELWYGSRYQVELGDSTNLAYKIACMYDAILQMSDYETGVLDVSFTTWEDQVALTPFQ